MKKSKKNSFEENPYLLILGDASKKLKTVEDKSIKLLYGSPPYPNAKRNYGCWPTKDYITKFKPFIEEALPKMRDDGFIVINIKANRDQATSTSSSKRSLVVERIAIMMEEELGLHCVDIEIWVKANPVPTGVRVACQDAYEYNLWFSVSPKWSINIDEIRTKYKESSINHYKNGLFKPRQNGLMYVSREKKIIPNEKGALPKNVGVISEEDSENPTNIMYGGVSQKVVGHQACQPGYVPRKYILATTEPGDIVMDLWNGSGTTGLETLKLGRKFIGFDIFKEYLDKSGGYFDDLLKRTG